MGRMVIVLVVSALAWFGTPATWATQAHAVEAQDVLHGWYGLMLELIRHTPTYTPPVASRTLGYVGVTAFEAVASGSDKLQSLSGQLNGLVAVPRRDGRGNLR